ncbi:MAG TPA: hypothetical protein PLB25_05825 [Rhodoferax sp.]|nr:hypothetical protein [Rhodoferax sp.]
MSTEKVTLGSGPGFGRTMIEPKLLPLYGNLRLSDLLLLISATLPGWPPMLLIPERYVQSAAALPAASHTVANMTIALVDWWLIGAIDS